MRIAFITKELTYEHLGIMYLSRILKDAGHIVKRFKISDDNIIEFKPDFVMYSVMTGDHKTFIDYNKQLKKRMNFISVFGGPHPTYFPDMIQEDGIDYIIRGEGEKTILKVLKKPKKKVILGKLTENLDDVSYPDRELLYSEEKHKKNPIRHFIASRGCPFDCPYCYNHIWCKLYKNARRTRYRSPQNIIDEIKDVISRYATEFIYFQDDCFDSNKKWLYEFLDLYKKNFNLPFHCIIRLDLLDDETTRRLSDAGCRCVRCAAESGNDYLRNKILKRRMTKKQIYDGTRLLHKYNIKFVLQNMLGLPESNLDRDLETLRLNIDCKPTLGWCSIFQPYPMTELAKGYDIDVDKFKANFYDASIIDLPHKNTISRLQKLFALTVRYSFLYHIMPILIRLPLDNVYRRLWKYCNKLSDKELYGDVI